MVRVVDGEVTCGSWWGNLRDSSPFGGRSREPDPDWHTGVIDDFHAPPPTDEELDALAAELGVPSVAFDRRLEGGLGCTMDVLDAGARRLVLRRYGPWHDADPDVGRREAAALRIARSSGVPVPDPIWVDRVDLFDRHAIVTSYVDGVPDLVPADPGSWARQLAAALAAIHRADVGDATFPPMEVDALVQDHPTPPEPVLRHELGAALWAALIDEVRRLAPQPSVLLHADYWPGNTLWRAGVLVAVVDWEQPRVGDPMADVAYCLTDIGYIGLGVESIFLDTYVEATGRTTESLRYWRLAALSRPMPDIAQWVPAWRAMGSPLSEEVARRRHRAALEALLG